MRHTRTRGTTLYVQFRLTGAAVHLRRRQHGVALTQQVRSSIAGSLSAVLLVTGSISRRKVTVSRRQRVVSRMHSTLRDIRRIVSLLGAGSGQESRRSSIALRGIIRFYRSGSTCLHGRKFSKVSAIVKSSAARGSRVDLIVRLLGRLCTGVLERYAPSISRCTVIVHYNDRNLQLMRAGDYGSNMRRIRNLPSNGKLRVCESRVRAVNNVVRASCRSND